MSTGNLPRLRECLIELHLPAFREHYAAQAALATQESLSIPGFSCRYLRSRWRSGTSAKCQRRASKKTLTALDRSRLPQSVDRQLVFGSCRDVLAFNPGSHPSGLCSGPEPAPCWYSDLRAIDLTLEKELKKLDRFEALKSMTSATFSKAGRNGGSLHTAGPSLRTSQHLADQQPDLLLGEDLRPPDDGSSHRPAGAPQRDSGTQRPPGKAKQGNHEMRKPRGGQIRAKRLIGPRKVLGEGDRRVPAKGRGRTAPYRGRQQTPARARGSSVRATPSLRPPRLGTISLLTERRTAERAVSEDGYSSFFLILVWGFQSSLREFYLTLITWPQKAPQHVSVRPPGIASEHVPVWS